MQQSVLFKRLQWSLHIAAYPICLGLIGLIFLSSPLICGVIAIFSPHAQGVIRSRAITSEVFSRYLHLCQTFGLMRLDLSALDALNKQPPLVIAPNHPSLIDVVLIMSRLRNCSCVAKNSLISHPVLGIAARTNDYISNATLTPMLKKAIATVESGAHVLIFPEGTRTRFNGVATVNALSGSACIIAKRAKTKVQLVYIQTNSGFLGVQWNMLGLPTFPIVYTATLGDQIDAHDDLAASLERMKHAYEAHLLPVAPQSM